jgi:SagB-type dehydrogenase family enzyme
MRIASLLLATVAVLGCGASASPVQGTAPASAGAVSLIPPNNSSIALPAPKLDGAMSVEKALHERRSLRTPRADPLTLEQVGQLCWAAQGITDAKGHRTASSAHASYPLELYVLAGSVEGLRPGTYRYEPASHALQIAGAVDRRAALVDEGIGQAWIAGAPAIFVVTGSAGKMTKVKERAQGLMNVEAGLAAQGFFLQATSLGLGSTYVGGFKPQQAAAVLGLPDGQEVLAVLPVGRR